MAGALPRYGTCVRCAPVNCLNTSPDRCCDVPWPAEPNAMVSGLALAAVTTSCTVL
ncbi:hypothetical protein D3C78_1385470 [compost metagenome]